MKRYKVISNGAEFEIEADGFALWPDGTLRLMIERVTEGALAEPCHAAVFAAGQWESVRLCRV